MNLLANLEGSHVHVNHVRKVLEKSLDIELAYRDDELTTELDTLGVAAYPYRDCDSHRLVLYDSEEIDVERFVSYRMPLGLTENSRILLAIVENEVDDVSVRSVGYGLEILCLYGEEYVLDSVSVKIARDEALCAERLGCCLAASCTKLTLEFNVLHFAKF